MVAGYVRLSRDDDKRNYVSIENQKIIINQYASTMKMTVNRWYEDDGVSGYSLNRPGFSKLMGDLEDEVDVIIAKDLSRIGRHNAKVLLLLDEIKERGKRLLLVDDNYDTLKEDDDVIGIKTWYNERYVKDTSKKIKRVLKARQMEGTLASTVPFGYIRDKKDKKIIHIVEEEAVCVRRIFDLYLQGLGYRKIAMVLTEEGIPTPSMQMRYRDRTGGMESRRKAAAVWTDNMVSNILKNDFYIGNLRLHKRERLKINGSDVRIPKEKQMVFPDNHKTIITKQVYDLVQRIMKKRVRTNYRGQGKKGSLFGGSLICKDCGARLTPITRKNTERKYYICSTYNSKGKRFCKYAHLVEENNLIQDITVYIKLCRNTVRDAIAQYEFETPAMKEPLREDTCKALSSVIGNKKKELKIMISQKIKDISSGKNEGNVINETYEELQEEIIAQIQSFEQQLKVIESSKEKEPVGEEAFEPALQIIEGIIEEENINRKDVEALIDKIIVDKDGNSEIFLKYGLDSCLKREPLKELNCYEDEIIRQIIKIIKVSLKNKKEYISVKHLSDELTKLGYGMTQKSLLPFLAFLTDHNMLEAADRGKTYHILPGESLEIDAKFT